MRKRYRWNPVTLRQEPIDDTPGGGRLAIIPDIEPFISPVDGTVVTGRAALREHNRRHGVTNIADFKGQWEREARERATFFKGDAKYDQKRRIEHLKRAFEIHERRK